MINTKRLVEMVKKWKVASSGRRRISLSTLEGTLKCYRLIADKGHFMVYAETGRRFMVPLHYLDKPIFRELLKMAEVEFGYACNGPITLPCDANFMEFVLSILQNNAPSQMEKALLILVRNERCSSTSVLARGITYCQELPYGD
ncbi:hypothetical protein HHK36_002861 [Tetracentron sinense]|uniref:Small auxin up regulated protein n=1 Tax=Tetracentron sinense TaxID=13715 RepID=A0A834ZMS5_TETSI|nr:hypothetical protein HHK36_002861 [Tetracentron sinense]